jgi:hypothetical protein
MGKAEVLKVGDKVIALTSVYDDGQDHHPPGYYCYEGDELIVKEIRHGLVIVAHEGREGGFWLEAHEFRALNPKQQEK